MSAACAYLSGWWFLRFDVLAFSLVSAGYVAGAFQLKIWGRGPFWDGPRSGAMYRILVDWGWIPLGIMVVVAAPGVGVHWGIAFVSAITVGVLGIATRRRIGSELDGPVDGGNA